MKTKNFKYKKGGSDTSMTRYKKYQNAGVYGQSQLNIPPPPPGNEQFRYTTANQEAIATAQQGYDEAGQDYQQGLDEFYGQREVDAAKAQALETGLGTGLTLANKGNLTANMAAQTTFKNAVKEQMAKGMSRKVATDAVIAGGMKKPMAQGLLGTGTASVAASNMINVGSLVGSVGGAYLERAWSDDDPTTYTFKEGVAGALKRGSTWAGYGNMILPGVGGLIGGAAGVISSIFSGKKKAREARKEEKRLKREFKDRQGQYAGRIMQERAAAGRQVGAMMGNRLGGPRKYRTGGASIIDPEQIPVAVADSTAVALTDEQRYLMMLDYHRRMQEQNRVYSGGTLPEVTVTPADNTKVVKKQMGGIQHIPEEQMVTMQQYQQPIQQPFQMNMSDNIPYLKGGYKLRY